MGLGTRAISRRIESGELITVHAGVSSATSAPAPSPGAAAAVLACGQTALLSHQSAAALWGMCPNWPALPEVTAPRKQARPGIRTHGCRTLARPDRRRHHGISVISPARTALEIAPRLGRPELLRAVSKARLDGYLHQAEMAELLDRLATIPAPAL